MKNPNRPGARDAAILMGVEQRFRAALDAITKSRRQGVVMEKGEGDAKTI